MTEPHWLVVALVGAILGFLIPHIWLYLTLFIQSRKKHPLEGTWYGYYFIFQNKQVVLRSERLEIKKGIQVSKVKLVLTGQSYETQTQSYTGEVWEEAGWLLIHMRPQTHQESILMRFKNPILGGDPIKYGLWSAIDFDTRPAVGPMILSRIQFSKEDAKKELDARLVHYHMNTTCKVLQVSF
jgi:hypothetical protein